ncbi:monovalent cation/H+ antiporter complex subunit F [Streptomyces sp. NPDC006333]|uniref:MrpF/PhaF family protein n=1 Tax=Streptomyces sp. NPDC006333 TaxID=3156753 RepID=UPI0033A2ABED
MLAAAIPVLWGVTTGPLLRGVVAQNFATSVICLVMLLLAQGYGRPSYTDLALVLAVLGPVGTLVYARLLAEEDDKVPPQSRPATILTVTATVPVVIASCVAAGPGRAAVKVALVGLLLIAGNMTASQTLSGAYREPGEDRHG